MEHNDSHPIEPGNARSHARDFVQGTLAEMGIDSGRRNVRVAELESRHRERNLSADRARIDVLHSSLINRRAIETINNEIGQIDSDIRSIGIKIEDTGKEIDKLSKYIDSMHKEIDQISQSMLEKLKAIENITKEITKCENDLSINADEVNRVRGNIEDIDAQIEMMEEYKSQKRSESGIKYAEDEISSMNSRKINYSSDMDNLLKQGREISDNLDHYQGEETLIQKDLKDLNKYSEKLERKINKGEERESLLCNMRKALYDEKEGLQERRRQLIFSVNAM